MDEVKYVKILDNSWPEYQRGGLYCRINFSDESEIFPIYYFYGKLKVIQTQVMKVFKSISK